MTVDGPETLIAIPASNEVSPMVTYATPPAGALTPSKIASYYKFNALPKTAAGASLDGTGQTIAIVNAFHNPTIAADLHTFNIQFGLPDSTLTIVNQYGSSGSYPTVDTGWALETAMDVEWAHAIAPKANILLVEASSPNISDLMQAVKYASAHASVVSMSWGSSEFRNEKIYDSSFNVSGVTFVTASGDDAGSSGADWPASSPFVVSVGGTTLSGSTETAWSGTRSGSGGGVSLYESQPAFQASVVSASGRVNPDVAYVANPSTGVAVYTATAARGQSGWVTVGGTSAGSPQWAGLFALTNQLRASAGQTALNSTSALTMLYAAAKTEGRSTPSTLFTDITSGQNAKYKATTGYDAVTGLGSPIASNLVSYLSTGKLPTGTPTTSTPTTLATVGSSTGGGGGWIPWFPWGGWRGGRFAVLGELTDNGFGDFQTFGGAASITIVAAPSPVIAIPQPITSTPTIVNDASRPLPAPKPVYFVLPPQSMPTSLRATDTGTASQEKSRAVADKSAQAKPNVIPTPLTDTSIKLRASETTPAADERLDLELPVVPDLIPPQGDEVDPAALPVAEPVASLLGMKWDETAASPFEDAETESGSVHDQALAALTTGLVLGAWQLRSRDRRKRSKRTPAIA